MRAYEDGTNQSIEYSYDSLGNILNEKATAINPLTGKAEERVTSYAYNELNSLIRRDDIDYSYDKRGNLIRESKDGATLKSYEWNKTGKLTSVTTPAGKSEYSYDGTGRMLSYKGYTYGKDKSLNLTKDEKYIPFYPSAIDLPFTEEFRKVTHVYGPEGEVGTYANYVMYSFTKDRLLSTRLVSDPKGEAVVAKDFGAYGEPIDVFTREDLVDNNVNKARYTGHVYDDIAGLYYAKARTYDPTDKRFTSLDPVMDGLNWYEYCRSNPLKYTDPTGNVPRTEAVERLMQAIQERGPMPAETIHESAKEDILANTGTAPYIGVFYLNRTDGAGHAGHTAMMLYRSDGTGDLYSFVGTPDISALKDSAYNDANVNYAYGVDVEKFLKGTKNKYGKMEHKIKNSRGKRKISDGSETDWEKVDEVYTRGIYFHISDAQGRKIADAANRTMLTVNGVEHDVSDYHLTINNCEIQTRKWLEAGGITIEKGKKILPNSVYRYNVKKIKKEYKADDLSAPIYGNLSDIWEKIPHKNTVMLYPFYR